MERYYRIARDVHGLSIFTDEKYKTHTEAIVEARKLFKTSIVKPKEIMVSEWQEGQHIGMTVFVAEKHGRKITEMFRDGYKVNN